MSRLKPRPPKRSFSRLGYSAESAGGVAIEGAGAERVRLGREEEKPKVSAAQIAAAT